MSNKNEKKIQGYLDNLAKTTAIKDIETTQHYTRTQLHELRNAISIILSILYNIEKLKQHHSLNEESALNFYSQLLSLVDIKLIHLLYLTYQDEFIIDVAAPKPVQAIDVKPTDGLSIQIGTNNLQLITRRTRDHERANAEHNDETKMAIDSAFTTLKTVSYQKNAPFEKALFYANNIAIKNDSESDDGSEGHLTPALKHLTQLDTVARDAITEFKTPKQKRIEKVSRFIGRGYALLLGLALFRAVFFTGAWAWIFLALPLATICVLVTWSNLSKRLITEMGIELFGKDHVFDGLIYYYDTDPNSPTFGQKIRFSKLKITLTVLSIFIAFISALANAALVWVMISSIGTLPILSFLTGSAGSVIVVSQFILILPIFFAVSAGIFGILSFLTESCLSIFGINNMLKNKYPPWKLHLAARDYFRHLFHPDNPRNEGKSTKELQIEKWLLGTGIIVSSMFGILGLIFSVHVNSGSLVTLLMHYGFSSVFANKYSYHFSMWLAIAVGAAFSIMVSTFFAVRIGTQCVKMVMKWLYPNKKQHHAYLSPEHKIIAEEYLRLYNQEYFGDEQSRWRRIYCRFKNRIGPMMTAAANVFFTLKDILAFATILVAAHMGAFWVMFIVLFAYSTFHDSITSSTLNTPDKPTIEPVRKSTLTVFQCLYSKSSKHDERAFKDDINAQITISGISDAERQTASEHASPDINHPLGSLQA